MTVQVRLLCTPTLASITNSNEGEWQNDKVRRVSEQLANLLMEGFQIEAAAAVGSAIIYTLVKRS